MQGPTIDFNNIIDKDNIRYLLKWKSSKGYL